VQMLPYDPAWSLAIEQALPAGWQPVEGTSFFTVTEHFQQFPGTTFLLGGSGQGGGIGIGGSGTNVQGGTQNFVFSSGGEEGVTGTGNFFGSGLILANGVVVTTANIGSGINQIVGAPLPGVDGTGGTGIDTGGNPDDPVMLIFGPYAWEEFERLLEETGEGDTGELQLTVDELSKLPVIELEIVYNGVAVTCK
ncbi:MAG TPA: hypothetical protein VIX81_04955, partial [Gammaproteobacteria bacterium]